MKFYLLTDETKKGDELAPFINVTYFHDEDYAQKQMWELLLDYRKDIFTHQDNVQFDVYQYTNGFTITIQSEDGGEYAYARLTLDTINTDVLINGKSLLDIEGY